MRRARLGEDSDLEGLWAMCHNRILGRINVVMRDRAGWIAYGSTLEDGPWQSRAPLVLSEYDSKILNRLTGHTV